MTLKEHGLAKFGRLIDQDLAHARHLTARIEAEPELTLCHPTNINIVCFRYDPGNLTEDELKLLNTEIMVRMQEIGIAAVSDTTVRGSPLPARGDQQPPDDPIGPRHAGR